MPDALITTTELAIHNGWADQTYPSDRAEQAIYAATAMIQAETGQRLITVTGDTDTLWSNGPIVWLPQRPVTAVTQIAITMPPWFGGLGATLTNPSAWQLYGDELWVGQWYRWPAWVAVTYSHGYAPSVTGATPQAFPEQIKWVCCSAASRLHGNPEYLRSQSIGGVSQTWAGTADDIGPGLTESERRALMPFGALIAA